MFPTCATSTAIAEQCSRFSVVLILAAAGAGYFKGGIVICKARRVLAACFFLFLATVPSLSAAKDIVIHAGRLVSGDDDPRTQVSILITDDRITAVQPGFVTPPGAQIIDLSQSTVLPGLHNMHIHLGGGPYAGPVHPDGHPLTPSDRVLSAIPSLREFLMLGFTSVRVLGQSDYNDVALRRAVNAGTIVGPRMWVATDPLGPTGGHSDERGSSDPDTDNPHWDRAVADGPDEFRKEIRTRKRMGADLIKIMPSGGVTSSGDDPNQKLMTDEEIEASVDAAHALGMRIAAHAQSDDAVAAATRLGVDSIEHGTLATDATLTLMKQRGTVLVPTMSVGKVVTSQLEAQEARQPGTAAKAKAMFARKIDQVRRAYRIGVQLAIGTDTSPRDSLLEFGLLQEAGVSAADIIKAGTSNAARLMGSDKVIGWIRPNYLADIIAVPGNPLDDVRMLENVRFVMKGGVVYRNDYTLPVSSPISP
jgi:imidazolonepropionase-like amidohydrolase